MVLCALSRLSEWCHDNNQDASAWQTAAAKLSQACATLSHLGAELPQFIHGSDTNQRADNRSLAWFALGCWRMQHHLQEDNAHAKHLAAALWAQRRNDGTLAIRSGESPAIGDHFPAVLDADDSPSAAAIAAQLFQELAATDEHWPQRADEFLVAHRPLLALTQLPAAGLAAAMAGATSQS